MLCPGAKLQWSQEGQFHVPSWCPLVARLGFGWATKCRAFTATSIWLNVDLDIKHSSFVSVYLEFIWILFQYWQLILKCWWRGKINQLCFTVTPQMSHIHLLSVSLVGGAGVCEVMQYYFLLLLWKHTMSVLFFSFSFQFPYHFQFSGVLALSFLHFLYCFRKSTSLLVPTSVLSFLTKHVFAQLSSIYKHCLVGANPPVTCSDLTNRKIHKRALVPLQWWPSCLSPRDGGRSNDGDWGEDLLWVNNRTVQTYAVFFGLVIPAGKGACLTIQLSDWFV